jgi:hypothetical protein
MVWCSPARSNAAFGAKGKVYPRLVTACDTKEITLAEDTTYCQLMSMMLAASDAPHSTLSHVKGTLTAHCLDMQMSSPRHVARQFLSFVSQALIKPQTLYVLPASSQ